MKKKVLVIGANGFTGRRILNDLSRNDEYIVTGCSLHDDIAPDSGNYRFISADICQMGRLLYRRVFCRGGCRFPGIRRERIDKRFRRYPL